jgi:hypothetical protein
MHQKLMPLVCIYCFFSFKTIAQNTSSFNFKEYYLPDKEIVYQDNFDDSVKKWSDNLTASDTIFFEKSSINFTSDTIVNGFLKFINRDSVGIWAVPHSFQIDYSKNFEVEINAKIQYTPKRKWSIVLFLGRDKQKRAQFFYLSRSKVVDLDYTEDSAHWGKPKNERGIAFNFNKDDYNKITFRKIDSYYYLFINEKFIKKFDYNPISGNIIGLGAGPLSEVWYTYIKVYRF